MPMQSRSRRVQLVVLAAAILACVPAKVRLVAAARQVSVESLIYDLKSPDAQRRQVAARELGAARHRPAIPQLVAMAKDPADAVRREVELTLERMDDMQTLPGFIAFASDTQIDIRGRAVASLVNLHVTHAVGVTSALTNLREKLIFGSDRDLDVVVEPDVAVDPLVVATLRTRLGDSERGIRRTAIRGLGILRARTTVPDLLQVVREDRDDGLRFEGVRALRKIGDASIGEELVAFLNMQTDAVRNETIATLGAMRYRGAVPELMRIAEQGKPTDVSCVLALSALADLGDPKSVDLFGRLKADKNELIRLYANEGIARTADARMKTDIAAARLVEKNPRVRTAQAFALLRLGQAEYLDELVRGLEAWQTRDLAREYLLETAPADRHALFAPRPANSTARAELADVMGLIGDPEALPRLRELAQDSDKDVARAAERATRRIAVASSSQ
jgi:HEAT repeat protein